MQNSVIIPQSTQSPDIGRNPNFSMADSNMVEPFYAKHVITVERIY